METSTQRGEEEILNLKGQEIQIEIVQNIDSKRCEIIDHALAGFSAPQTMKIFGYIKKKRIIVLINSSNAHR